MTEGELQAFLERIIPARDRYGVFVEECQDQDVRLRFSMPVDERWSTPALLALIDASLQAAVGTEVAVTHLAVTMIHPAARADVLALSRVIRRDRGAIYAETWLFSHAAVEPMLHATATLGADP
ncbi:MAG: hypothetical protein JSR91_20980 [Proteobacteria bacterium]|nr:hypothetical protein [Pseudomonadota bacterium]